MPSVFAHTVIVVLTTVVPFQSFVFSMESSSSPSSEANTLNTTHQETTMSPFTIMMLNKSSPPKSIGATTNPLNPTITFHNLPHSPIWINETFHFFFNPPSINDFLVDSNRTVKFNCTTNNIRQYDDANNISAGDYYQVQDNRHFNNKTFLVLIQSNDGGIAKLVVYNENKKKKPKSKMPEDSGPALRDSLSMQITLNKDYNFTIKAMHIGYVTFSVTLLDTDSMDMAKAGFFNALSYTEYHATVKLAEKSADFVFDCSAAAVAILISFGIGCVTDTESLKKQLKYPVSLVIGFCCQFLIMPMLAFGIAKMLPLRDDVRFGLLCVACVPGGGLGHVAVIIGQADLPLSLAMNLISIVAMLGTAPLWIFVLGQYFQRHFGSKVIPIYNFEIWLASTFFAYTAGLVINRFKPVVADALLTWIIKPFMLLAAILYITLGVYINMYVFDVIDDFAVLAAFLLPLSGFIVAFTLGKIFRQKTDFCKSVALETSSLNCLIVLAAIRFSLPRPCGHIASTIPMWVMFTIPGLYVLLAILRFFKRGISNFLENRKQQQFRHFSIASGIVNQANMAALSAPLFVTEVTDDEQGSISEKITVL